MWRVSWCANLARASNWRSVDSIEQYLQRHGIPGLFDVDTRQLTRHLRNVGAQKGAIGPRELTAEHLLEMAQQWSGLEGADLVQRVTCPAPYEFAPQVQGAATELRRFNLPGRPWSHCRCLRASHCCLRLRRQTKTSSIVSPHAAVVSRWCQRAHRRRQLCR